ncbi:hypothetical protein HQ533_04310 [Candidatus Woesearchaeota archaeon]|nr:hypothetical protein [Candidatus Woesearchaeota archaeon]
MKEGELEERIDELLISAIEQKEVIDYEAKLLDAINIQKNYFKSLPKSSLRNFYEVIAGLYLEVEDEIKKNNASQKNIQYIHKKSEELTELAKEAAKTEFEKPKRTSLNLLEVLQKIYSRSYDSKQAKDNSLNSLKKVINEEFKNFEIIKEQYHFRTDIMAEVEELKENYQTLERKIDETLQN